MARTLMHMTAHSPGFEHACWSKLAMFDKHYTAN